MTILKKLLIFGTGDLADVAAYYFKNDSEYEIIGYIEPDEIEFESNSLNKKNVYKWNEVCKVFGRKDVQIFVAIGYKKTNSLRELRYSQVIEAGFECASYISSHAINMAYKIGSNCFILENNVLQPFVEIGNNVFLWSGNHIGHHSKIKDNVFIASHAVISGKCIVEKNSFLGVNCTLHDGITIGEKSIVGAGSIVTTSCEARSIFIPEPSTSKVVKRDII